MTGPQRHRGTEARNSVDGRPFGTRETGLEPMRERMIGRVSLAHRFDPVSAVGPRSGPTHRRPIALWLGGLRGLGVERDTRFPR